METKKLPTLGFQSSELLENLRKKRPNLTRLDIVNFNQTQEKLFEQSIELTQIHRKLSEQNQRLRKDFKKVQQAKIQRQSFISQVQKIVKEKSHELNAKNPQKSSCLVFKLQQKIFDLKQEIQNKNKAIRKLHLSKENQILFRKETDVQCLREINEFASSIGIESKEQDLVEDDNYEQIVWMDDYLQAEKIRIEQLESQLEQEERQSKRIMTDIAGKKCQLKKIKDIQRQYLNVQESYILEKKRKQEKMFDNKSYLTNLIKQRDIENAKFQTLKQKRFKIQEQETIAVMKLQQKLESLQKLYQSNKKHKTIIKPASDTSIKPESTEQWVKRVSIQQVQTIAKNMNLCLALNGITEDIWINEFFKDELEMYSILQVMNKLSEFPFYVQNDKHKKLLARYFVEDIDHGLMLQDLNTCQDSPIIKSVMKKLIGFTKIYTSQEQQRYREELGEKLGKFWPLVEQSIHIKQGVRNLISREMLEDGLESAQLQLNCEEVQYIVLYLFSWSKDVNKLELNKLGKIKELGIQNIKK